MSEAKAGPTDTKIEDLAERLAPGHFFISLALGILGTGATAWFNIRNAAREAVTEEKFLGELAARVRPSCVFDQRGAIVIDSGAGKLFESIDAKSIKEAYGFEIKIKFNKHVATEPILGDMNVLLYPEVVKRGPMH